MSEAVDKLAKPRKRHSTLPCSLSPQKMKEMRDKLELSKPHIETSTEETFTSSAPISRRRKKTHSSLKREKKPRSLKASMSALQINTEPTKSARKEKKLTPRRSSLAGAESIQSTQIQVMVGYESPESSSPRKETPKEKKIKNSGESKISKWFSISKKPSSKKSKVFGACIADLVHDPQNTKEIPIIIRQCVDYLMTQDAHLVSGIFRKSGSHEVVENLKKQYHRPTDEPDLSSCEDPHCIAGLLKQFLASMSEPVIPFSEYEQIITNFNHYKETNEKTGVLRNFVNTLPEANKNVLLYLMRFLTRVGSNSDSNMMTTKNLGLVFAPTLLRPEIHTPANLMDMTNTEIISHMIEHYRDIFHQH